MSAFICHTNVKCKRCAKSVKGKSQRNATQKLCTETKNIQFLKLQRKSARITAILLHAKKRQGSYLTEVTYWKEMNASLVTGYWRQEEVESEKNVSFLKRQYYFRRNRAILLYISKRVLCCSEVTFCIEFWNFRIL